MPSGQVMERSGCRKSRHIEASHEPLNERTDDLADEGKTLTKTGDDYQWIHRTTRLVYSSYDRASHQWKKDTWSHSSKTIRNTVRRGTVESLMEDRLQRGENKWWTELFKPRPELWEGEQIESVGLTKGLTEKWETVPSGKWIQRETWNRMVTRTMWEEPHTTPVTTTWTTDFLTQEGEDRMVMDDCLHNKSIPWKTRRRGLSVTSRDSNFP
jgi:hypothetical protein